MREIVDTIERLKSRNRRFADQASRAFFINKLSVQRGRQTAFVETAEIWYSPLVTKAADGTETAVPLQADQLNVYTPVQFYILRKVAGRWYIDSNPAPAGPRVTPAPTTSP